MCYRRSPFEIGYAFNSAPWSKLFSWSANSGLVVSDNRTAVEIGAVMDVFAPETPGPPTGSAVNDALEFSWTAPESFGVPILSYQVRISSSADYAAQTVTNQTSIDVRSVTYGAQYCISVVAVSVGGLSVESDTGCTTAMATCPAGSYILDDFATCVPCPMGQYADQGTETQNCTPCGLGTYAPQTGMGRCIDCSYGFVAMQTSSIACTACPVGATCEDTSSLMVSPGMWRGSFDLFAVYDCPFGVDACLGGNTTYSCGPGYGGVLCAVCERGFVRTLGHCMDCGSLNAPVVPIILAVAAAVTVLTVWYLARVYRTFAAAMESISLSVPLKIYFSTCQILGTFATLLSDVLFQPLKGFLAKLTFVTDLADLVGGFGVSCAHHELRSLRMRLLLSTVVPIIISLCVVVVFKFRVLWSPPNLVGALRRAHSTFILLLLYVILPSTSTMIFQTFVRDSRPLGTNGEQYLIADYAGKW